MTIKLSNFKTNAEIQYENDEFTIDENTRYRAYCDINSFKETEINPVGTFIDDKVALISVTNKVGKFSIGNTHFRVRSKLGDDFFDKVKKQIEKIEKNLLISTNGVTDSLALTHGQYIENVAISLFLKSWKRGEIHSSLRYIFENPSLGFTNEPTAKDLTKGAQITSFDFQYLTSVSGSIINVNGKNIPKSFDTFKRVQTHNVLEMRFVKFFLFFCFNLLKRRIDRISDELSDIENKIKKLKPSNSENGRLNTLKQKQKEWSQAAGETNDIQKKINAFLKSALFKSVKLSKHMDFTSLKLHNHFHFKRLLSLYLQMRRSFETYTSNDSVYLDIDSLENLYEYYCLIRLLRDFDVKPCNIKSLVKKDKFGWVIDKSCHVLIGHLNDESSLTLSFKNKFSKNVGSYSQTYDPDYTIKISKQNKNIYFHLDAKYKLNNGKVKKEDIDKMHTYTHAIKNSIGSYVLFPGGENVNYTCENSMIGGFFCTPLKNQSLKSEVEKVLNQIGNT